MPMLSREKQRPERTLERLVRYTVLPEIARRRPGRVLLLTPDPSRFPRLGDWNIVCLSRSHGGAAGGPVTCETGLLPFQDGSFDIVLLHHVAEDGREAELHESWRVLSAGGDIFVIGAGGFGLRALLQARRKGLPRMRVFQVCQQLRRRAFEIEQCAACGIAGIPLYWERWWQRPALPLADTLVIHGRHRPLRPIVKPLRFGRTQAVGARRSAVESLMQEAG